MTLDDIEVTTDGVKIGESSIGGCLTQDEKHSLRQVAADTGEKYTDLCKQLYIKKMNLARRVRKENEQTD